MAYDTVKDQIIQEMAKAEYILGAYSDLLAIVKSYGDTLEDEEILAMLKIWNKYERTSMSKSAKEWIAAHSDRVIDADKKSVKDQIIWQMIEVMKHLETHSDMISPVGSYGDAVPDEDVLQHLREWTAAARGSQKQQSE